MIPSQPVRLPLWQHLWAVALALLPYLTLLLVHHFLVAPLRKKHQAAYYCLAALLLAGFFLWCFASSGPPPPGPGGPPPGPDGLLRIRPEWMKCMIGILIIGADWASIYYRDLRRHKEDNRRLRQENLRSQLESLRRQINPHFFLNTLNNIQALVLTDPEKAAESIQDFSKLMQTILYEGDAELIPLADEVGFLERFISLMKLRYTEHVDIRTEFPPTDKDTAVIQPLVLATFLENAFKHGVSYGRPSFIRLSIRREKDRILCRVANSVHPGRAANPTGGIGLENIQKRLKLVYKTDFQLRMKEHDGCFDILLDIPANPTIKECDDTDCNG